MNAGTPRVDLNAVAIFIQIVEKKSLTAAARALELPKSTVSRKLSQLEARLGVRLLQRTPRQLRLTEAGVLFHERCADLLARVEEAESAVSGLQEIPRGRLRVSAGLDFGTTVLGPLVQGFVQLHPQLTVELVLSDRTVDLVGESFDVAIRIGSVRDTSLVARRLGPTHGVLCASPAYLARQGTPAAPEELARHACVVFNSPPHTDEWKLQGPEGLRTVRVSGPLFVNSLTLVRDAALAGLGIARLPLFICGVDLEAGRLRRVLPSWSTDERLVHAVYPSSKNLSRKVRVFVDFLAARVPQAPGMGTSPEVLRALDRETLGTQ